jgi:hypothetical protein
VYLSPATSAARCGLCRVKVLEIISSEADDLIVHASIRLREINLLFILIVWTIIMSVARIRGSALTSGRGLRFAIAIWVGISAINLVAAAPQLLGRWSQKSALSSCPIPVEGVSATLLPTPTPGVLDELRLSKPSRAYLDVLRAASYTNTQSYNQMLDQLRRSSENVNLIYDCEWRKTMSGLLVAFEQSAKELGDLPNPPAEWRTVDTIYKEVGPEAVLMAADIADALNKDEEILYTKAFAHSKTIQPLMAKLGPEMERAIQSSSE